MRIMSENRYQQKIWKAKEEVHKEWTEHEEREALYKKINELEDRIVALESLIPQRG